MKTKYLLASLLVASVSINAFVLLTGHKPAPAPAPAPAAECDLPSYSSPVVITYDDAVTFTNNYREQAGESPAEGGYITGDAIQTIFDGTGANALYYRYAVDNTGSVQDGKIFLVISGATVTYEDGSITGATKTGTDLHTSNNWCPPNCAPLR